MDARLLNDLVVLGACGIAALTDLRSRRIPNTLTLTLSSDPSFPDSDLSNNVRTTTVTLGPVILKKGKAAVPR